MMYDKGMKNENAVPVYDSLEALLAAEVFECGSPAATKVRLPLTEGTVTRTSNPLYN
jgi:hypothetical protein